MTIMKRQLFFAFTIILFAMAVQGQNDPISVETNLITLNVSVTDRSGGHIKGLLKDDFKVLDEGREQERYQSLAQ